MIRAVVIGLALAGCGRDISLGNRPIDSADQPDATVGLVDGDYRLEHGILVDVACGGRMMGMEASFADDDAADGGLVDGVVALELTADGARVSGAAIESGYATAVVEMVHDLVPEQPADAIFALVEIDRAGPLGTRARVAALGFDLETATAARVDGQSGLVYALDDALEDSCALTFVAALVAP